MRAAGSPGTCGAGFRSAPSQPAQRDGGCLDVPEKPPDAAQRRSEGRAALPAQRTRPRVTDGAFPSAATAQEEAMSETVDVDGTTEVAGL